jgi:hypothetical protein
MPAFALKFATAEKAGEAAAVFRLRGYSSCQFSQKVLLLAAACIG